MMGTEELWNGIEKHCGGTEKVWDGTVDHYVYNWGTVLGHMITVKGTA